MKLFLSSAALTPLQSQALVELAGKANPENVTIALIEDAADPYPDYKRYWMYENRSSIQLQGFVVDVVHISEYKDRPSDLRKRLAHADVIWLGGGNVYYLRWILRLTGAERIITDLAPHHIIAGSSAGAIVLGPSLHHFETADTPTVAPDVIYDGLGLTPIVALPHWSSRKFGDKMKAIEKAHLDDHHTTVRLTDEQALVIHDGQQHLIG